MMMRKWMFGVGVGLLSGCAALQQGGPEIAPEQVEAPTAEAAVLTAPPPPPAARSAEAFDTTTEAQRAAAATPESGGQLLGRTIGSLGNPAEAGFWIETPLVDAEATGRIVALETGKSAQVILRPLDAEPGAGSRVSLAAMRLLGVALTDLPEIEVYRD